MPASPLLSHCAALIRAHDHDRYVCTLFAPAQVREAWFALFAFNHELAVIPESVSEELTGLMRFAWWREALDEIYAGGAVRKHLVAEALALAVGKYALPRAPLDALLGAREAKFMGEPFTGQEEWEDYFRATSSGLLKLCALAAKAEPSASLDHLGIAWSCIGTMRMDGNSVCRDGAAKHLESARHGLPEIFTPFRHAAEFYLKRLKRGKGRGGAFGLPLTLCWRRFLRQLSERSAAK